LKIKNRKIILLAGIIILILILNNIFDWSSYISDLDNLVFLEKMVEDNIWVAAGIYIVITIIGCVVLALPGVTFAIFAGLLFGPWMGTLCCSLATTIGAILAFIAGRFFLKDSIKPVAMKNKYLKKLLFDETGRNEVFVLMITRLVPLFPFNLQNFAYGVTDIKFNTYSLCSFLFMLPGTAMYTIGTAGLTDQDNRLLYICMALLLGVLVIGLGKYFQKKFMKIDESEKQADVAKCVHCGKCTTNCEFLKKYKLDIGQTKELEDLAYHCFLCGRCSQVCPQGIDGREIILDMRKRKVNKNHGKLEEKGYGCLLGEKEKYIFQNYRHVQKGSVLFPGCNFPSFYPKTTKLAYELLNRHEQVGLVYDCCRKPVEELGKSAGAEKAIQKMNERFRQEKVGEVIMMCPNCYYFLKSRLEVKVVSIYEKLAEFDIGQKIAKKNLHLFIPCPDREKEEWVGHMQRYLPKKFAVIQQIQCCGLGGCAGVKEPELAKKLLADIKNREYQNIYTYCGTCAGNMTGAGCTGVKHMLAEILESKETADVNKSFMNRMKTKFI